jgi:hypothetical protein
MGIPRLIADAFIHPGMFAQGNCSMGIPRGVNPNITNCRCNVPVFISGVSSGVNSAS